MDIVSRKNKMNEFLWYNIMNVIMLGTEATKWHSLLKVQWIEGLGCWCKIWCVKEYPFNLGKQINKGASKHLDSSK